MMMISLVSTYFYFFVLFVYKIKKPQIYILATFLCIKQTIIFYLKYNAQPKSLC